MSASRPSKIVPRDASHKPKKRESGYRNAEFSAAVASLGVCMVCGYDLPTTHCHSNQSKYGKGKSIKASDYAQWCGCNACHMAIDQGAIPREIKIKTEEKAILSTYRAMCANGMIGGIFIDDGTAENWIRSMERGAIFLRADWRKL